MLNENQSYIAFLNNPSIQDLIDIGNFIVESSGKPFFTSVVLFAANINGHSPDNPELFYNSSISTILNENIDLVQSLQKKGMKIQLSYLGNHQNSGWSCNMSESTAKALANNMVEDIFKYGLDGINIDDEYSACSGNGQSFYWITGAIKNHPKFKQKILTKALWKDLIYFQDPLNVADFLDEGYEMTYVGSVSKLDKYIGYGMKKENLFLGISPEFTPLSKVKGICSSVINSGYNGVMIWAPNSFFTTEQASRYYTEIIKAGEGDNSKVVYTPGNNFIIK
ncbi:glycoside hydrolase family 18 protein [Photorhabdus antumapuensis]|uniref:glycosyl hydrolase family 18 protein n=1 Tax=Photorhabdus antumapuensis TaxID=2862867 RepID=UPI001CEC32F8|nr:glycosyl hydrolase family 18 protein [Photorhabdus antumapuensis]MCA6220365.1 hypothetical protein [Photorhabdus antumapuensis]